LDEGKDREQARPPEPSPADAVLDLQRSAGNRAVGAMLARQPAPTAPKSSRERAATMTAGLGEKLGVIPIDSFSWGQSGPPPIASDGATRGYTEVTVNYGPNPIAAEIARAAMEGDNIGDAFVSTQTMTVDFDDVVLTDYRQHGEGTPDVTYSVTLNFASMHFREPK
jgi:hypothetical protein